MVTVRDIYDEIDRIAPFYSQMDFDNSGLLVGEPEQAVARILVALDITESIAWEAAERNCQLIVSHHPVIFNPVKQLTTENPTGRILISLVRNRISAICCHTNVDMAEGGVNDCLAEAVGLEHIELLAQEGNYHDGAPYGIGRVGTLKNGPCSLQEFLMTVDQSLRPNDIRFVDAGRTVCRVAVGGGSCGEYMDQAIAMGCDTFLTSDLKYHGFLDGKDKGINLIDAGHYPTENPVCTRMANWIRDAFPEAEVLMTQVHSEVFDCYYREH